MEFLAYYGYMNPEVLQNYSQIPNEELENALRDFQMFVGLEQTGKLDTATCDMMKKSRCGVKDKFDFEGDDRSSKRIRTASNGIPWNQKELTYRIFRYPKHLQSAAVNKVVEQAFAAWASVTDLHFRQISALADINIAFGAANHSHFHPFRPEVYGHAFFPPAGSVDFNEDWSKGNRSHSGLELFWVALHEFGHVLGVNHSMANRSIMYPYLQMGRSNPNFPFDEEDVRNIQALYGPRRPRPANLCSDSSFDAIFEYPAGVIYVLKGEYHWKLTPDGIASGYPRLNSHRWAGLPSNIDAATATSSGLTYFFKGNSYWTYYHTSPHISNPSYICVGWPGIPDNVDGAMWCGGSVFYFFKGSSYWRYAASQSPQVPASYPKLITVWGGIEGVVDDVLYVSSGYVYFFMNGTYSRYNCATGGIDHAHHNQPDYPRPVGRWWFQCDRNVAEENVSSSNPFTINSTETTIEDTAVSSTSSPTTIEDTTVSTTANPTTIADKTISTIASPTTTEDTAVSTTASPRTIEDTAVSSTVSPTTIEDTAVSTTASPATIEGTTVSTTASPVTIEDTTVSSTTSPTTTEDTTISSTTNPTTIEDTTVSTTASPTTIENTTISSTASSTTTEGTAVSSTASSTVNEGTTVSSTASSTTIENTTISSTASSTTTEGTAVSSTASSTTIEGTAASSTIIEGTTASSTTIESTTVSITTSPTATQGMATIRRVSVSSTSTDSDFPPDAPDAE
ncbi:macrophage metalloelastase isoform X2 [Cryptotermes secundus]|uniref:macrophage metalloelastase isoform X2 n=1 Tax=Cryptotermes secundus TaxID=105785 RepID=UPI000CD7C463|nr:macrophage metalloelastase isoform X2 [Cryptotermes secundus]